ERADGPGPRGSPAADVYNLGALLYLLLTGRSPLGCADATARQEPTGEERLVPPRRVDPQIPRALEQICLRALAQDPEDRYPSAGELERVLRRYIRRRGTAAAAFAAFVLVSMAVCALSFRPPSERSVSIPPPVSPRVGDAASATP
ncbi:MAG: hypothetical protein LC745_09255, partial [Planctomycetia bacterium]|nr:hypothetical protein [Planctomycetia bacterium]